MNFLTQALKVKSADLGVGGWKHDLDVLEGIFRVFLRTIFSVVPSAKVWINSTGYLVNTLFSQNRGFYSNQIYGTDPIS